MGREALPRQHVPGYKSVLINEKVKEELTAFRRANGLIDSQMERCLVSAAISLLLKDGDMKAAWMSEMRATLSEDTRLVMEA